MKPCKACTKCKIVKDLNEFHVRSVSKDGRTSKCSLCLNTKALKLRTENPESTRGNNLKQRFDMTIEDYNVIFLKQKGKCAICRNAETNKDKKGKVKWLSVDHNHDTGDIRGLLCSSCNTGIGLLQDSKKLMKSAIKYLDERGSYGK
jgi:hypothetical protein